MEKFVTDYPAIAVGIIASLAGFIYLLVKIMVSHLEKRIEMIEEEVDHQRTNYTEKFKEVHDKIDKGNKEIQLKLDLSNREIIDAITVIKLDVQRVIDAVDKQVAVCKTIQKLKEK